MRFRDRKDAGQQLAAELKAKAYQHPVVLGIPRGGVPVAAEVARALGCELGVIVARKMGAPGNPELAIGATTATGSTYINSGIAVAAGANQRYIAAEKERQVHEAQRREALFDGRRRPLIAGRTIIVVDDGVATGATAIAALRSTKAEGAARVVLAVPVGPIEMVALLDDEADEVVCLDADPGFWAVGQAYDDFSPVTDDEVRGILDRFDVSALPLSSRRIAVRRDRVSLVVALTTPAGKAPFPLVIFVHGLGSSKDSPRNLAIASQLVDEGIATLLFDLSGHGESSFDAGHGIEAYVADLEAVFAWAAMQDDLAKDSIGIAGSSLGATVAAMALAQGRVSPRTLVLRAPPLEAETFARIDVPSLVLIGSQDPLLTGVVQGVAGCAKCTLSIVEGASHLFDEPGTLAEALRLTVGWFRSKLVATTASR